MNVQQLKTHNILICDRHKSKTVYHYISFDYTGMHRTSVAHSQQDNS